MGSEHLVPAFRLGGGGSGVLSASQMTAILATVAAEVVPNWEDFDYGGHSLLVRIGREYTVRVPRYRTWYMYSIGT